MASSEDMKDKHELESLLKYHKGKVKKYKRKLDDLEQDSRRIGFRIPQMVKK